jgi:hypothetical protein
MLSYSIFRYHQHRLASISPLTSPWPKLLIFCARSRPDQFKKNEGYILAVRPYEVTLSLEILTDWLIIAKFK